MKKYHYFDGGKQFGPLTIEELNEKKISKDTLVWFEGLDNWIKAGEVEELKVLFKSVPPPINVESKKFEKQTNSSNVLKKYRISFPAGIVGGLIVIAIISLFLVNRDRSSNSGNSNDGSDPNNLTFSNPYSESTTQQYNNVPPPPRQKTEEELRQELYYKEKNKPKDYLSLNYRLTRKVLTGEDKIIGKIYNSASIATFKDIVLTVQYSTGTGTELSSKEYVVYQYVYPGSSTSFTIKTYSPRGTRQIGVTVKGAIGE